MLEYILKLMQNGISLVKESALTIITACAENMKEEFIQFSTVLIPLLMQIVDKYNQREYKQFRGLAVECLAIIL